MLESFEAVFLGGFFTVISYLGLYGPHFRKKKDFQVLFLKTRNRNRNMKEKLKVKDFIKVCVRKGVFLLLH